MIVTFRVVKNIKKRYKNISKKQLSMIFFYFPCKWTIEIIKLSNNNNTLEAVVRRWYKKTPVVAPLINKAAGYKNFSKFTRKDLCRSVVFNNVAGWKNCKIYTTVSESRLVAQHQHQIAIKKSR